MFCESRKNSPLPESIQTAAENWLIRNAIIKILKSEGRFLILHSEVPYQSRSLQTVVYPTLIAYIFRISGFPIEFDCFKSKFEKY